MLEVTLETTDEAPPFLKWVKLTHFLATIYVQQSKLSPATGLWLPSSLCIDYHPSRKGLFLYRGSFEKFQVISHSYILFLITTSHVLH